MSWERTEYKEVAPCACGKGTIVRLAYTEDDDWNRSRGGIINEKLPVRIVVHNTILNTSSGIILAQAGKVMASAIKHI